MPSDPKEHYAYDQRRAEARACREQAAKYVEMARTAPTLALRQTFAELAAGWNFLADQIDASMDEPDRTGG